MDLKNNTRNQEPKPTPDVNQSHYCESNAGHLSVQTTSPFRLNMMDSEYVANQKVKGKNDRSTSVSNKKLPNEACSSTTSRLLVNQIIRDNNLDGVCLNVEELRTEKNLHQVGKKCNYSQNFNNYNVQFKHLPTKFNSESSSVELGLFPREESVTPAASKAGSPEKCVSVSNSAYSSNNQNNHVEKSTYCQPIMNFKQEFVKKSAEKNARLQALVKKLIIARKKEKETEAWNNYINELKNKFEHSVYEPHSTMHSNSRYFEYINNYYTQTEFNDSNTYSELLRDFYETYDVQSNRSHVNYCGPVKSEQSVYYNNQADCYPMSSQGRLMMLNKERKYNQYARDWLYRPPNRYSGRTIIVDREYKRKRKEKPEPPIPFQKYRTEPKEVEEVSCNVCKDCVDCKSNKSFGIQTSSELLFTKIKDVKQERSLRSSFHEQYEKVSQNVDRLKKKIQDSMKPDIPGPLASIEDKLDKLITSLNTFIDEVKSKISVRQCYNCQSVSYNPNKNVNISRSETFGLIKAERLVCGLLPSSYTNSLPIPPFNDLENTKYDISHGTSIDKILNEEIDSSKKAKEDIENILSGAKLHPCEVHVSLDIPTKERSTEVTDSLSQTILKCDSCKPEKNVGNDIPEEARNMTIAVNTDPLGLLALLRVSTETLKQLLSYMPNFPYYSYLPMIQPNNSPLRKDFVCKICGAAFGRPSQLSAHIESHNLGKTRDCCVCRHILDMQSQRMPGLFCCRYCGQRFTRAYCCELHQDTCAKRFGLKHEGRSSLMLLR